MQCDRTHRRRRDRPLPRVEDERGTLPAPESSVGADLLLEGGHFAGLGIEGAHDDEVAALRHRVDPAEALRGGGPKSREGIHPLCVSAPQVYRTAGSEDDGCAPLGAEHDKSDPRMADEAVDMWLKPYERPNDTTKAMSEYLSWEVDLIARIERDGTTNFVRFGP